VQINNESYNPSQGFTLAEAAVTIGVVAILAGIIVPLVLKALQDARYARARNDIQVIVAAIASQLKDTGRRPAADGYDQVNQANGRNDALWFSSRPLPQAGGNRLNPNGTADQNNTFRNLFTCPGHAGNALFGLGDATAGAAAQYKGPYLGRDTANKPDPWGNAYLILGYNADGQATGGPIWVVSAGKAGTLALVNLAEGGHGAPPGVPANQHVPVWDYTAPGSQGNLAVRAN
jgi:type II secretory pathway pseudopilin PulG